MSESIRAFHTLNWPYICLVQTSSSSFSDDSNEVEKKINAWCKQNCKSQFGIMSPSSLTLHAPVTHESPISGENYDPSSINIWNVIVVIFENAEEATGFKMAFYGNSD